MGVLNVTPDSFSDGGRYLDPGLAEARALQMQNEGADLLDIGGESTRPGSKPVSTREELRRVLPVLKRLSKKIKIPISVDTTKYEVASAALDEGALLINDISALRGNRRLAKKIAASRAAVVLMHMQGKPKTMQKNPSYKNCVKDIFDFLKKAVYSAREAGISKDSILIDPGFGFGKTMDQNMEILKNLNFFSGIGSPLLVGLSRKSFIGHALHVAEPDQRLYGSLATAAAAIFKGAHVLRVHDVLPHRQLALLIDQC